MGSRGGSVVEGFQGKPSPEESRSVVHGLLRSTGDGYKDHAGAGQCGTQGVEELV